MKKIMIQDLKPGLVNGVEVQISSDKDAYKETYFEWTATPLVSKTAVSEVSGGVLKAWHHAPVFSEIETHIDSEMFFFISGVALMLFMDAEKGKPCMDTAQVVRIQPGTQIVIKAGKGHFVPVAEGSEPVCAVVAAPGMDAPRMSLAEAVEGIK